MKSFSHHSLKSHNTFNLEAFCDRFIELDDVEEVRTLIAENIFDHPFLIMGGGSNLLFAHDFAGTVIHPAFKGINIEKETDEHVWVRAAAGEEWETLVAFALQHQYYGLENLIGIPGNVGSCPVQNIGAYGVEAKDVIEKVEAIRLRDGIAVSFSNKDCQFAYRNSIFKNEWKNKVLITHVIFKLSKIEHFTLTYKALGEAIEKSGRKPTLPLVADTVLSIRNSKLPRVGEVGSAGSFFKNPIINRDQYEKLAEQFPDLTVYPAGNGLCKLSAAQLIDRCGCKQWRDGDVAVYPTQPLVIVNYGNACGKQVVEFYHKIIAAVKAQFGITLTPEVNIIGE